MESVRCPGCMQLKQTRPLCEHCGYNENIDNHPHQLPVGTRLQERYEVGKALGQGGFGITYIGWDHVQNVPVAIKEFYPNGVVNRESGATKSVAVSATDGREIFKRNKERFLKEAHTLARLSNVAEIVHVYSLFEENNTAYIVMEYLKGVDLRRYIRMVGGKLSPELTFAILRPVMTALQKVHEEDMVHRDISPDNIMLMNDGSAKLLDFGSAREVLDADPDRFQNQSTEAVLKHGFAPMEQYQRNGTMGPWTDVYSLAATFYYCMTGRVPADAPNRIMDGEQIPWSQIAGLTPAQVQALEKAMELIPKDRTRSVRELELALFGEEKPAPKPQPKPAPKKKVRKQKPVREKKPRKIGKVVAGIAAVAAVAAIALGGKALLPQKGPEISIETSAELDMSVFAGNADRKINYKDGSRIEIYLDEAGRENGRILLDEKGAVAYRFQVAYDDMGNVRYQNTYDGNDQLLRTDGFQYDDQGQLQLEALILPDGSVGKSIEYTHDAEGNVTRTVIRNGRNAITGETRFEYDSEGNEVSATYLDEKGNKEGMTRYVEYQQIDVRLSAQQDFAGFAAVLERGGLPVGAGIAGSGSGAIHAGSGIRPGGAVTAMWEIDNGGGGGGGGSKKKPSGRIDVAVTEPDEEPTEPVETTVPAETQQTVEEMFSGPVEQRMVCTRREYYDKKDRLSDIYVMTYDSRGRKAMEECYNVKGTLIYTHIYFYDQDTDECIGYEYRSSGDYVNTCHEMNDSLEKTVRTYSTTGSSTGYSYYNDRRNISESLTWDLEGNLDSRSVYSYDEYGTSLGYTYTYWSDYDGSKSEYTYDGDYKLVSRKTYDSEGNLKTRTEPQHDEDDNLIREITYNAEGTVIEQTDYTYDSDGILQEYRWTSYTEDGGKQVSIMDGNYNMRSSITYDASGAVTNVYNYVYEFDANGNKTKQSVYQQDGSLLYWYEYTYDENGQLLDSEYHSG